MAKKVLKGAGYDLARLVGIKSEMWANHLGREPKIGDTMYAIGDIQEVDGEYGLVVDDTSGYYNRLPDVHKGRVVEATGNWIEGGEL